MPDAVFMIFSYVKNDFSCWSKSVCYLTNHIYFYFNKLHISLFLFFVSLDLIFRLFIKEINFSYMNIKNNKIKLIT